MRMLAIMGAVIRETNRQVEKWGEQHHQDVPVPSGDIDVFELLHIPNVELAKGTTDQLHEQGEETWADILLEEFCEAVEAAAEITTDHLREELVQVAAVAASWIADLDSRS